MTTLATIVTQCQMQLDSRITNGFWQTDELRTWINDGVRDIARRTETILNFNSTLDAVVGQAKYMLPPDVIRVHRIEFTPSGSTQIYPISASTYDEMDAIWGINPTTQGSYPDAYAIWGTPGQMTVQFYPVPSQTGTFNIYYYGMPANLATDGTDDSKNIVIPAGWDDAVVMYVEFRARRKAKDPLWQEAKQLYDDTIGHMVDVTRQAHDNQRFIQTPTSNIPQWLYGFEDM